MKIHQMYNPVFGILLLNISTCLAAAINDYATRESRQLVMVPKATPVWFPFTSYDVTSDYNKPTLALTPEVPLAQNRLFGLTSLLAAARQCPTCPTCPAATTCPTCPTCQTIPTLNSFSVCPSGSTLTAPYGTIATLQEVTAADLRSQTCTFTITTTAPYTKLRIICPFFLGWTAGGTNSFANLAYVTTTAVEGSTTTTIAANTPYESKTNSVVMKFATAALISKNVFSCTWQAIA